MAPSICFVGLDNYPVLNPAWGHEYFGGESVQQTLLAKAFVELGYRVSMLVKDVGQPDDEKIDGVRVLKTYRETAGLPVLRFVHPRMSSILTALNAADADTYYQSCAGMLTGLVARHCRRRSRRFVFRLAHDTDCIPGQQLIRLWRDRKIYEYGLRRADFIAAQGTNQVALLSEHYALTSTPVNMAVELPTADQDIVRDIDVLWVNNHRPFKRPELAVDLAERMPDRRFAMIGGPVPGNEGLFEEVRARAARLENLDFVGAVPYQEVNAYFSRARVFANTSDHEGFPNSYLQAWIRGVAVVSFFDPDGLIEAEGLGSSPDGLGAMTEALRGLLDEPARLREVSERCRAYALTHYAPAAVARRYMELGAIA